MGTIGYVPARFLCLVAHFIITVTIFFSREQNVEACLPIKYTEEEYDEKDTQLVVALSLTLGFLAVELFGFFGGLSTFMPFASLISICLHASACVSLAFFIWDVWNCDFYWYILGFCSAIPAFVEISLLIGVFGLKKGV